MDFKKKAEELAAEFTIRSLRKEMSIVLEKKLKEVWNEAIEKSGKVAEIECKVYSECSQKIRELKEK